MSISGVLKWKEACIEHSMSWNGKAFGIGVVIIIAMDTLFAE